MALKKINTSKSKQSTLPVIAPADKIIDQSIEQEMQQCYLDYAMSVIVSRALPDVRDGLKPVHRRILYAMWRLGLRSGAKFRKSATVVGEVLGKYHPHGDLAVYDSMVRLAQDFSMRYPLVWGQGNFGSMDGDSPAAHRYTEAKLKPIADEMLNHLDENTVDFVPNYDGTIKEPIVLPAQLPNLLLMGSVGIAVGMATNIPPHQLGEVIDGVVCLIDNPDADIKELVKHIKGPDFPTGGIIYDHKDIEQAYTTGHGRVIIRAKTEIVEDKNGSFAIIVHEIPYQVNKSTLVEKIADLVKDKKVEGIKDLRDESNREGVRIVIELKKDSYPKKILNQLFKYTQLQDSVNFNMLALVDGLQPKVLNLKMILEYFIKHRQEVVRRQLQFELDQNLDRVHILQGLKKALDNLDAVIKIIRKSKDRDEARLSLMKSFKFSERQANAILDMRLSQLTNLDRMKLEQELKDRLKRIKEIEELLASVKKMLALVKNQLLEIKNKYNDERRTQIVAHGVDNFSAEDLIPNEPTVVTITKDGYIKRLPPTTFKAQGRGGKGVIGLTTKEEDEVEHLFTTNTHNDILFFTSQGRVFQLKAYDLPQGSRTAKGQAIVNFLQLAPQEKIASVLPTDSIGNYKYLVMVTQQGFIKRVELEQFSNIRRSGLIAIKLKKDDNLQWVKPSAGSDDVILISSLGQAIRFKEKGVRTMGRGASGVRGMRLKGKDEVVGMAIADPKMEKQMQLSIIMSLGYGKRTGLSQYKVQGRGGSGIKTAKITPKTGHIVAAYLIDSKIEQEDLVIMSSHGQAIRLPFKSVPILGRATQGVRLMRFKEPTDKVASVTWI